MAKGNGAHGPNIAAAHGNIPLTRAPTPPIIYLASPRVTNTTAVTFYETLNARTIHSGGGLATMKKVRCSAGPLLLHDDRRADLDPIIEIDHVLIGHANAAR